MKKLFVIVCLLLPVLSLNARAIQEDYKKAEEKARLSYAFGMAIGSNFDLKSMGLEFDYDAFAEGLKAMVENGEGQFTEQEAMEIIETALQKAMDRRAVENLAVEEAFLAANRERPEIQVTPSGLQYEILVEAEGEKPKPNSIVRVFYAGTFIDGSPFDSSDEDEGAYIPLEMVISGWTEGLLLMSEGSKYRFYIPSHLAYGKDGIQSVIPPYSALIFTVELLEIIDDEDGINFGDYSLSD
jgi:FKBP-type peptidyl-prolyl cis-trans isomerase